MRNLFTKSANITKYLENTKFVPVLAKLVFLFLFFSAGIPAQSLNGSQVSSGNDAKGKFLCPPIDDGGLRNASLKSVLPSRSANLSRSATMGTTPGTATDFWSPTSGPLGGYIDAIATTSSGITYAGSYGGGVFRSSDGGTTWISSNSGLTDLFVQAITISDITGDIFAGTSTGVFSSVDGGLTWNSITGLTLNVTSLMVDMGVIYAGTYSGVYTWVGSSWSQTSVPSSYVTCLTNDRGTYYAGTWGNGIYRSTNGGSSWQQINTGLSVLEIQSIASNGSGLVFAGTYLGGAFRMTAGGANWTAANVGLTSIDVQCLVANKTGYLFAGTYDQGVFRSMNNGSSWTQVSTNLTINNIRCLADGNNSIYAGSSGDGIFKITYTGTSWTQINQGLTTYTRALGVNANGDLYASVILSGIYRSTDQGSSWTHLLNAPFSTFYSFVFNSSGSIFGASGVGVYQSTDNGATWASANTGLTNLITYAIAYNKNNGSLYVGGQGGVFESINNGGFWTKISTGLTDTLVRALEVNSSGQLFAGTYSVSPGIFRSTNNGVNWSQVASGLPISAVRALAFNGNTTFAGTAGGGAYRSIDNGASWQAINNGLTDTYVNSIVVNSAGTLYAGTPDYGVFTSSDNGNTWTDINTGLTDWFVVPLALKSDGTIFAGTGGSGVFSGSTVSQTSTITFQAKMNIAIRKGRFNPATDSVIVRGTFNSWTANTDCLLDPNADSIYTGTFDVGTATPPEYKFVIRHLGTDLWERQTGTNRTYTLTGNPQTLPVLYFDDDSIYTPQPPIISDFIPKFGTIGTTVTISGTSFNKTASKNIVFFGGVRTPVAFATETQLTVASPAGANYAPITVTVDGLTASTNLPFVTTFSSNRTMTTSSFDARRDFSSSPQPSRVVMADFDGDGKLDVAATVESRDKLTIYRNTGSSGSLSLATGIEFTVGQGPNFIAVGDLDGDGNLDLAVTNGSQVSVLRNMSTSGNIAFASKVDFATSTNASSVAIGDLDGDGKQDLVVTCGTNVFCVFRNTSTAGNISFAPRTDTPTGIAPQDVSLGDIDGDGKPDLVIANQTDYNVSIFRNVSTSGTISFASRVDISVAATTLSLGDIDGDGKLDIVVTNKYSNVLSVARNTSSGNNITFMPKVDYNTGSIVNGHTLGDIDGDGKPDFAVVNNNNTVSIIRNNSSSGSVVFDTKVDFPTGTNPRSVVLGDLDGDSKPDLVIANYSTNTIAAYRNTMAAATTGPAAPSNLTATAVSSTQIDLSWTDNSNNEDGFKIELYMGFGSFAEIATVGAGVTSYQNIGLSPSTNYSYQVRAYNAVGNSNYSNTANATTQSSGGTIPNQPTTMTASAVSSSQVDLVWVDNATNEDGFKIERKTGTSGTFSEIGTNPANNTGYSDYTVAASTLYYYRVRAYNSTGNSTYSNEPSVTTPAVSGLVPSAPTNLAVTVFNSSRLDLNWTDNATNEDGYYVFRKTGASGSYSLISTLSANTTTYQDVSLSASTTYYYFVSAYNSSGNSNPSNEVYATTQASSSATTINHTPPTTEVVVTNGVASSSVDITASASDPSGIQAMQLQYRSFAYSSIQTTNFTSPFGNPSTVQIPAFAFAANGKASYVDYRIKATSVPGAETYTPWYSISVRNASVITMQPISPFPSANTYPSTELVKAYRIFSVPYNLDDKTGNFLGTSLGLPNGDDGTPYVNWRLQRIYIGAKQDINDFTNDPVFTPGAGFFLIIRNPGKTVTIGQSKVVKADQMSSTGIVLTHNINGWYLLGNPFDSVVGWDSLVFTNGTLLDRALYTGDGPVTGWVKNVTQLSPWEGAAVKIQLSGAQPCTVKIKSGNGVTPKMGFTPIVPLAKEVTSPNDWVVKVDAYRSDINMRCEGGGFGMHIEADIDHDRYDSYQPPYLGDKTVTLGFSGPNGPRLLDVRPLDADGGVWDMKLTTIDAGARVKLNFAGALNLPDPSFEVYLIDPDEKIAHNLKLTRSLEVGSGHGTKNFRIVVGKKGFINENNAGVDLLPSAMTLYPNYPNPFNPQTVIRYTIPNTTATSQVQLTVFNVLGQEVATLVNREQPSGYYEVNFDGTHQSSGVYYYRLVVSDEVRTSSDVKKMVLIK